jgi:hypothetical protein
MLSAMSNSRKRLITAVLAVVLLGVMFSLMIFASIGDSGTVDEVAHIPSGYSYDKYQDYRLNPEHPPLAKALAGLPLAVINFTGLKADWSWEAINQWESGWYFLYEAGNDPGEILFWARLPMILLSLGLGLLLFFWAKGMYGRKIGLLVLTIYAFYPDILGHGHLVTTDVAAAFGFAVAIYAFSKIFDKPSMRNIFWAGIAFGLAQLLKFSAFLLFGILLILVAYKAFSDRKEKKDLAPLMWKYFKYYISVCLISLVVVWLAYIPFVWNTPVGIEHKVIEMNLTNDARTLPLRNFLHLFEGNPITRALGHYILGIMLVVARVAGGNATYIVGHLSDKSISWFFPVAYLIKTPIPIILLTLWSVIAVIIYRVKSKEEAWQYWLFLTPIVVYWAFTLKGSLNIGIRHLMPTIPFILMFMGLTMHRYVKRAILPTLPVILTGVMVIWLIVSTLSYFPQYIAYFNEFVPRGDRYKYMTDSSLDWGQDLLRLKEYVDTNAIDSIKVDYFGGSVPEYFMSQATEWHSSYGPTTGWIAVSATYFQSSKLYGPKEGKWSYQWLEAYEPEAEIGGSILVYHITSEDLASHPPVSPYAITHVDPPGSLNIDRGTPSAQN